MSNPIDTYRQLSESREAAVTAHSLSALAHEHTHGTMYGQRGHKEHLDAAKAHAKAYHAHKKIADKLGFEHPHAMVHASHAQLHKSLYAHHHIQVDNAGKNHKWEPLGYEDNSDPRLA